MRADEFAQRSPDEVTNQAPALENVNLARGDTPLLEAVEREGAGWVKDELLSLGGELGRAEWFRHGVDANTFDPTLRNFDRFGRRED